jgi:Tfp pilus assembly protein PilW
MNDGAARRTERGSSLVELLVATSIGLGLAALAGHTLFAYQAGYHRATSRVNSDQQAQRALALMAEEVASAHSAAESDTCPTGPIRITDGRLEFWSNLYDRSTFLSESASAGMNEVVVASHSGFESGDLVKVVTLNDPADPGDDVTDCLRIAHVTADRWTVEQSLVRSVPAGSAVTLVNRVTYALDRQGRLMRTQDGGTQRIAQDVATFASQSDNASLVLKLTMRGTKEWTRRVIVEADR